MRFLKVWRSEILYDSFLERLVHAHSVQYSKLVVVVFHLFATREQLASLFCSHVIDSLSDQVQCLALFCALALEQPLVVERLSRAFLLVILKEVLRLKEAHERRVDVVLQVPNPTTCKGDSVFLPDRGTVASCKKSQKLALRHVVRKWFAIDKVDYVLCNDRSHSHCVNASL